MSLNRDSLVNNFSFSRKKSNKRGLVYGDNNMLVSTKPFVINHDKIIGNTEKT